MAANSPPALAICRHSEPEGTPNRRVKPIRRGEVTGAKGSPPHRLGILTDLTDVALHHLHAGRRDRVQQCAVQRRPAHAAPSTGSKGRGDAPAPVVIADAMERPARGIHAETVERSEERRVGKECRYGRSTEQ